MRDRVTDHSRRYADCLAEHVDRAGASYCALGDMDALGLSGDVILGGGTGNAGHSPSWNVGFVSTIVRLVVEHVDCRYCIIRFGLARIEFHLGVVQNWQNSHQNSAWDFQFQRFGVF